MRRYVIVGNGVAGVTAAQAIVRADPNASVHIFGAEAYAYYRRPLLWAFIAGEIKQNALIFRPENWYAERSIQLHLGVEVKALDPEAHRLTLADGSQVAYDRLLLATGGRSFIPPCEGTEKDGVFALRTLDDALAIKAYLPLSSPPMGGTEGRAVIIGGGLLGLETARALHTAGLEVTVVEFFPHLLPRQLDPEGARVLQSLLEAQGLHILTGAATEAIVGDERAMGVRLKARPEHSRRDGHVVDGELVIFSTGMRSEIGLAQTAGADRSDPLEVNRGIVVDNRLRTSAEDVFAAGDAAEFEGRVLGIIPPAIEQARVAAANMVAPGSATYAGTVPSTTLKVAGAELTSLGESVTDADEYDQLRHTDVAAGHYRKLVLREGRIVGAILLNDKERAGPIKKLVERKVDVSGHINHLLDDDFDLESLLQ